MRIYVRVRIFLKTSVCICMFIINTHPQRICVKETIIFAKKISFSCYIFYCSYVFRGRETKNR